VAQTYINTATQAGNFEDLVNFITNISPKDTPFLTKAGKTKAKGIKHEWMQESLRAGGSNAKAEGYTPSFAAGDNTVRVRKDNQCQIVANPFSASKTQEVVDKAGLGQGSEYERQKLLKTQELAKDTDYVLLNNSKVVRDADAGTAGQMDGVLAYITTNVKPMGGNTIISEDVYGELTQLIAEAGGSPDTVLASGFQRRMISSWTSPIREIATSETTLSNTVQVYRGDFGEQAIVYERHMPTDQIAVLEMKYWKVAYLRPVEHTELGIVGDLRKGFVLSELTLEALAESSSGKITGLKTSI